MGDGAFSNVYKAIERKTGRKVAVKVVRKYELNSSQVCTILLIPSFFSPSYSSSFPLLATTLG
jgi:serine/threonine protein kinase